MLEYRCFHCGAMLRDDQGIRTELGGGIRVLPWLFEEPEGLNRRANLVDLCPRCHQQVRRFRIIKVLLAIPVFVAVLIGAFILWLRQY